MHKTDIVQETRDLAKASKLRVSDICRAAQIKPRWYFRFLNGDFMDPGANKIARLHDVLSRKPEERRDQERRQA